MGASPSKDKEQRHDPPTPKRDDSIEKFHEDRRVRSSRVYDDGSFIFIDKERSCSISSAEDAVLVIDNISNKASAQPQNEDGIQTSEDAQPHNEDGMQTSEDAQPHNEDGIQTSEDAQPHNEDGIQTSEDAQPHNEDGIQTSEDAQPTEINCEDLIAGDSQQTKVNHEQQDVNKVESVCRKESDSVDIVPHLCTVGKEFSINMKSDSEVQNKADCLDNCTLSGKEEWIQITGRLDDSDPDSKIKLIHLYEIFSNYGSISALATTKDHIYIKFSSWAGTANVFDDIKNLRQLHYFTSLLKVEDDTVKSHPDRSEIHLDLPSLVVSYLKDHAELSRAIVVITMTVNDNTCLNAPKIQQILDNLKNSVSKGFQHCALFPFGCHVLGSWDRSESLEIFVDTGNMYAGCHKQSDAEQRAISKEVRKLMSHDITWSSLEESPIGVFYHKTVGLKCILYFNNGFGDRCTRLLGVFMDYDERFRVLYFVLDTWSRQCSLQGISNAFNSYIVAVLLVFYLQMLPVPLLPPLQRIRAGRPVFIKGWDCTFIEDASMIPRNGCTTKIQSLLRGFFVFYGNYDWDRVVCPALGQSIDRKIFSHPPTPYPDDLTVANYFRAISEKVPNTPLFDISTSMCVQDFFNLSENIGKCVSSDTLFRFQSLCRQSHKMMYAAESKLSCGPHNLLHSSNFPLVPFHERNVRTELFPSHFNPCAKEGPFDNYSATSRPVLQNENHEAYGARERFFPRSCGRGFDQKNNSINTVLLNNNNEESRTNQLNGRDSSRGKQVRERNSLRRPHRGRVFWHNRNKNTQLIGEK